MLEVLVAEVGDRALDRAHGTVGQRAERPAEDVVALVEQQVEVALLADSLLELGEGLHQPPGALPARRALAAGLVLVELGPAQHRPDHAGGLVEELERAGAEHRAGRDDLLEPEGYVEVLVGQQRRAGAAGGPELQQVAVAHAAGQVDQLAKRDAERGFVLAGSGDVAGEAEDPVALGLLGAHRREPRGAVLDDARHRRDRLDVVDHGRAGVEAGDRGERRTQARLAAAALESLEQRGLLATDVGAGAGVHDHVEVVAGPVDVLAEVAGGVRLLDRGLHAADDVQHLSADVDEGEVRADRERADDHALHEDVRVGHHQRDVLAGARLRLVGVHDEVLGLRVVLRDERPLHAGREAGAAAAAEAGVLDRRDDRVRVHAERRLEGAIAAAVLVGRELPGLLGVPDVGEDRRERVSHSSRPLPASSLSRRARCRPAGRHPAWSRRCRCRGPWHAPAPERSTRSRVPTRDRPATRGRHPAPRRPGRRGSRPARARPPSRCRCAARGWR